MDSGAFRALYDPNDKYHLEAMRLVAVINKGGHKMITTDYAIDESYTGLLTKTSYAQAMEFDKYLRQSKLKVELITPERFTKAQEVFRKYNKDKKWSFTDCTSYVVMKELRLKKILTFDKNFEEMGFEVF